MNKDIFIIIIAIIIIIVIIIIIIIIIINSYPVHITGWWTVIKQSANQWSPYWQDGRGNLWDKNT